MDRDCVPAETRSRDCMDNLAFVKDTADRMMKMIGGMLDYACLQNCSGQFGAVALEDVLGAVKLNLRQSIEESRAAITHAPLPVVWGDRMQLTTLLQELIYNAIKYRKPGTIPTVKISSRDEGAEVRLAVTDTGIGFHPDHKRTVFKPYQQLSTHAKSEGSGIGLASCAKIVKLHGGIMGVNPTPDQGATFYFTLPTSAPAQG